MKSLKKMNKSVIAAAALLTMTSLSVQADPWIETGLTASVVDVTHLVRGSLDKRLNENLALERHDGGSVWLDLNAVSSQADNVGKTTGYDNDVWAVHLGADIKKGDSFFGVIYSYAYSEGESKGNAVKQESAADFFSVQVFGQQTFGSLALSANGGWMHSHGEGTSGQKIAIIHANTWTADLAARLKLDCAGFVFIPYAKVETTYIDTKPTGAGTLQTAFIQQFPVGVEISRTFEAGQWRLRPVVDLAVVPTTGDTSLKYNYLGQGSVKTQWLDDDKQYRARLGLTGVSEKTRLSLQYEYLDGSDGRNAHTVDMEAKYVF